MGLLAQVTEEQRTVVELAGMPEGWLRLGALLLLAAVLAAIVQLYRAESRVGAGFRLRLSLAALRCAVVLTLSVILLEPAVVTYTKRIVRSTVVLLVDDSASMSVTDSLPADTAGGEGSRMERVQALLLNDDRAWLRRLAERNALAIFGFGERLDPIAGASSAPTHPASAGAASAADPASEADIRAALRAAQSRTDLSSALTEAAIRHADTPIAAVVVISDGQLNAGAPLEDAAAVVERNRCPVYTIGVGSPVEPPNVRVVNIAAPATVSMGDPIELRVELGASGVAEADLVLEIIAEPDVSPSRPAEPEVVARREVRLGEAQPTADLRIPLEARKPGETVYRARVASIDGEGVLTDNEMSASVRVQEDRLRVLLLAGRPSFEYRFVSSLLQRDNTIDVSCWLQSADAQAVRDGDVKLDELPRAPEKLFQYDAILLLDPDPRELDASWAVNVRRLVDDLGGGVLYQAGPQFSTRWFADNRLQDLNSTLPVVPDPDAGVRLSEFGAFRTRSYAYRLAEERGDHPLVKLSQSAEPVRWDALAPAWWYFPLLGEKPLATVLLRAGTSARSTSEAQPAILATQPFGAGRTVYIGFDGTWRWRGAAESVFNRFWVQAVRYLAQARRQNSSNRGAIVLDRDRYHAGDYAKLETRILNPDFSPWHEPRVDATFTLPDGRTRSVALDAIADREGWYSGRVEIDWHGSALIQVPLPGDEGSGAAQLVRRLDVQPSDAEMRALRLNEEPLIELSERTNGRYLPLTEAGALPSELENADQVRTTRGADRPLWDRSWVLLVLIAALAVEWTLRRRNHLL